MASANPLHDAIMNLVKQSPEFQKISGFIPPTTGIITGYNKDTQKINVEFNSPIDGSIHSVDEVDIGRAGGMNASIDYGDIVLLVFPDNKITFPLVAAIIDASPNIITGYSTTKISGGI
jgi:hypothetical protein